ncbi:MAG: DUF4197 domain-containing protein [Chitinophagaceae bacterium]|nr:DUF4197 domain-containing protein [Chitinophagaceae bacterium]
MKKLFLPLILAIALPVTFSCNSSRLASYLLTEGDAAMAIRQLLELGSKENMTGAFSKEQVLSSIFPQQVTKALNTLNMLGLTTEVDRFTTTLSTAAEKTATASVPIFVKSINNLKFTDAVRIIKNGGTAATDYLRTSAGDTLRRSITPIMQATIAEYKLNDQWNKIMKPVQAITGSKVNVDLANLMAGLVAESMFRKIAEKEVAVRSQAAARTTTLLQKVFSRSWN